MLHEVFVQLFILPVLAEGLQVNGGELPPVVDHFILIGVGFHVFGYIAALGLAAGGQFLLVFFYQGRVGAGGAVGFAPDQAYQEFGQGIRCGGRFRGDHQVLQVLGDRPFVGGGLNKEQVCRHRLAKSGEPVKSLFRFAQDLFYGKCSGQAHGYSSIPPSNTFSAGPHNHTLL